MTCCPTFSPAIDFAIDLVDGRDEGDGLVDHFEEVDVDLEAHELLEALQRRREHALEVGACVKIKILRRVRAESPRRPPRHRRDTCSMAWRCRFLTARRN